MHVRLTCLCSETDPLKKVLMLRPVSLCVSMGHLPVEHKTETQGRGAKNLSEMPLKMSLRDFIDVSWPVRDGLWYKSALPGLC